MQTQERKPVLKKIAILVLAIFVLGVGPVYTQPAEDEQILINSADWFDVYSAMCYANLNGLNSKFVNSPAQGKIISSILDRTKPVHLIQSSKDPIIAGHKNNLECEGFTVSSVTTSDSGKKLNMRWHWDGNSTLTYVAANDTNATVYIYSNSTKGEVLDLIASYDVTNNYGADSRLLYHADNAAEDSSTNNNWGTPRNGADTQANTGVTNLSREGHFNAANDEYVEVPTNDSLNFGTGNFSISLWFNTSGTGTFIQKSYDGYSSTGGPGWVFFIWDAARLEFALSDTPGGNATTVRTPTGTYYNDSQWHHVVISVGRGTNQIGWYVDGVHLENDDLGARSSSISCNYDLWIGANYNKGATIDREFDGDMNEVAIYNRTLNATEVSTLYNSSNGYQHTGSEDGLVSAWHMNEDTWVVQDSSGSGNNGTLTGGCYDEGVHNAGFKLDGTDDYVFIPSNNSLNLTGTEMTLEAWVKWGMNPGSGNSWAAIINKYGDNEWRLQHSSGNSHFEFAVSWQYVASTTTVQEGVWYHVVGVYNGTHLLMYVDGELENTASYNQAIPVSASDVYIGRRTGGDRHFNGTLDEIAIYNRSLSAAEVLAHYNEFAPTTGTYTPSDPTSLANTTGNFWINHTWSAGSGNVTDSYNVSVNQTWHNTTTDTFWNNTGLSAHGWSNITVYAWNSSGNGTLSTGNVSQDTQIPNNIPTQSTPILNSTYGTNLTSENLTCYNQSTADLDSDPVRNLHNWYCDNESITVLNLPFEGGSNATYTKDYSGFGNNGSVSGAVWNMTVGYDGHGAYEFNGSNSHVITVSDHDTLDLTNEITITCWVKFNQLGGALGPSLVYKYESYVFEMAKAYDDTYQPILLLWLNGAWTEVKVSYDNRIDQTDQWYHLAATYDGGEMRIYIDGSLKKNTSASGAIKQTLNSISLGPHGSSGLNGTLDEVMIYNRSLSAEEIQALHQSRTDRIVSQDTIVCEQWRCCITPNDGYDDGVAICSNNLTVLGEETTPPDPTSLANTTGNFWINHTWQPGSGVVTDSYNVSVNQTWHNTTTNTFWNNTGLSPHGWSNITVYAWNNTGNLSAGSVSQDTQIPNNPITITNTSDWNGDPGENVYVDYDATDADSDTPTFSCNQTDLFTDFDAANGTGNWTAIAGTYYVDFGVSDGWGSTSNYTMTITVSGAPPTFNCTCGDICVNTSGWWYNNSVFNASGTPIQAAVDNANASETICVKDGTYNENVDVGKRLTIRSENGSSTTTVNASDSNDHVFNVTVNYVNISGFTVKNATANSKAGIRLTGANYCNISDNSAIANWHGIYLSVGCEHNNITNNNASFSIQIGILLHWLSSYNYITDNVASSNVFHGIRIKEYGTHNTIKNNTANDNGDQGIYLFDSCNYNTIIDNTLNANSKGICIEKSCHDVNVTNNTIANNTDGIYLIASHNNSITCNWIHNSTQHGFYLTNVSPAVPSGADSTNNNISYNNIITNGNFNGTSGGWEGQFNNSQSSDVEAKNNYWGTTVSSEIAASIEENTGNVTHEPFLNYYSPCAPGYQEPAPNITSFAPESPVNDTHCTWRKFNVSVDQNVNVTWYLNETEQIPKNISVTEANYTFHAEYVGDNNVSAVAENANGTDMQTWIWNVTTAPNVTPNSPPNCSSTPNSWAILNATVTDADNDNMTVNFYANNNSNGLNASEGLVYATENVANGTTLTYNLTALPIKPSEANLSLLMHFDNRSEYDENDTHVYDFSRNGNNGTVNGNPSYNISGGKFAGAFEFDGTGDYVDCGNDPGLPENTPFTVSAWVKLNSLNQGWKVITDKYGDTTHVTLSVFLSDDDKFSFTTANGTWNPQNDLKTGTVSANRWYHVVAVWNGTTKFIYLDGDLSNSTNPDTTREPCSGAGDFTIGGRDGAGAACINGTIDEVAIYNRSLSEDEILNHYRLGDGKYYWKVNASDGILSNESDVHEFTSAQPVISSYTPAKQLQIVDERGPSYKQSYPYLQKSKTLNTSATLSSTNGVGGVRFIVDQGKAGEAIVNDTDTLDTLFCAQFPRLSYGNHTLDIIILNESLVPLSGAGQTESIDPFWIVPYILQFVGDSITISCADDTTCDVLNLTDVTSDGNAVTSDNLLELPCWDANQNDYSNGIHIFYSDYAKSIYGTYVFGNNEAESGITAAGTHTKFQNNFNGYADRFTSLDENSSNANVFGPTHAYVMLGLNDKRTGVTEATYEAQLSNVVNDTHNKGIPYENITLLYPTYSPTYDVSNYLDNIDNVANNLSTQLIKDLYNETKDNYENSGKSWYSGDNLHFTRAGSRNISRIIAEQSTWLTTGEAIYTEFSGSETTDFNNLPDITNVSGATLQTNTAKITWYSNVNASGANFDTNVDFGFAFVDINATGLNSTFNSSANVTLYNLTWSETPVIFEDGSPCQDCTINFYSGGNFSFNVTHFTNYSAGANANLTIWDDTDPEGGSQTKYINEQVNFYANYTNITSGQSINGSGVYCNISFNVSGWSAWEEMTFNSSTLLYDYNRSFSSEGTYDWNVTCNGSVLGYESLNTSDNVTISSTPTSFNISVRVIQSRDDAEENLGSGAVNCISSDLELINDNGADQEVGVRFQDVNIPNSATINSAYVEFEIDHDWDVSTNLTIFCEDADNPIRFSAVNNNITNRTKTSLSVDWNNVASPAVDEKLQTPDLASIVQVIVNRAGWAANNSMVFIINGTGRREVESYNGANSSGEADTAAPLLVVNYSTGGGANNSPNITLNNPPDGSTIPNNWTILNATVTDADDDNMTVYFYVNNNSNGLNDSEGLVYIGENVANGTTLTYNLTALPIKPSEANLSLLMHFDNRSEFGEHTQGNVANAVYDFSGNGNNGTLGNATAGTAPTWNVTGGKFAGAFEFDGTDDFINCGNDPLFDITNNLTLEAWVNFETTSSYYTGIVAKWCYECGGRSYGLFKETGASNNFSFHIWNGSNSWILSDSVVATDTWYHVVGTYNGTTMLMYVNGVQQTQTLNCGNDIATSTSPVTMGIFDNNNNFCLDGTIDEVAIYNRTLSASEILDHYRLGGGKYYWKVNATDGVLSNESDVGNFSVFSETLEIRNQTASQSISSINFSGATGATVTDPHNNEDGSGSPQNVTSKTPVVTIYNPSSSTDYKIWLKVEEVSGWSAIINDEKFNVTADDTSPGAVSSWTTLTSWGSYKDTGVTVSVGTYKDLYLAYELKGSGTGTSTVSVLGEAV